MERDREKEREKSGETWRENEKIQRDIDKWWKRERKRCRQIVIKAGRNNREGIERER